jgi:hypothetical protein
LTSFLATQTEGNWLIAYRRLEDERLVDDLQRAIYLADPNVAPLVRHLLDTFIWLGRSAGEVRN